MNHGGAPVRPGARDAPPAPGPAAGGTPRARAGHPRRRARRDRGERPPGAARAGPRALRDRRHGVRRDDPLRGAATPRASAAGVRGRAAGLRHRDGERAGALLRRRRLVLLLPLPADHGVRGAALRPPRRVRVERALRGLLRRGAVAAQRARNRAAGSAPAGGLGHARGCAADRRAAGERALARARSGGPRARGEDPRPAQPAAPARAHRRESHERAAHDRPGGRDHVLQSRGRAHHRACRSRRRSGVRSTR